jgi:nucleoside-diphosphate-sugar epimerase
MIVVTGASGFVGQRLLPFLAAKGHRGLAVSRRPLAELPQGWTGVDRESLLEAGHPSLGEAPDKVLIHLEVRHHVDSPAGADLAAFQAVNVEGTRRWLEWCCRNRVSRLLHFSSIKAVGPTTGLARESEAFEPSTPYGESKRSAEKLVEGWARGSSLRSAVILRPAVIYGPGNAANIFSMVRGIDRGRFLLVGAGENVKSLVSITNVVAAVEHFLVRHCSGVEVYNLVDPESYTVRRISELVAIQLGRQVPVRSIPLSVAHVLASLGDFWRQVTGGSPPLTRGRLAAMLETTHFSGDKLTSTGFRHPQSTEEGLREMVAWYLSRPR